MSAPRLPRSVLMDVARPRIIERAYLGADKSAPYKTHGRYPPRPRIAPPQINQHVCIGTVVGGGLVRPEVATLPTPPTYRTAPN
ncbi:MAG: hypothetical protein FWG87_12770 [Defluviitaleaceae bacterium]|nr:hypothetical protein [Defluviitaleaceae bacterium]